jgi:hypothetical protein
VCVWRFVYPRQVCAVRCNHQGVVLVKVSPHVMRWWLPVLAPQLDWLEDIGGNDPMPCWPVCMVGSGAVRRMGLADGHWDWHPRNQVV